MERETCEMEKAARMESPFALPNSHFILLGEISEQAALAAGNNTL